MNAAPLRAFGSTLRKLHSEPDNCLPKPKVNDETHLCRKDLQVLRLQTEAATHRTTARGSIVRETTKEL